MRENKNNGRSPDLHQIEIAESACRDCKAPMKIAIGLMSWGFYGPERFNDQEIKFAEFKGACLRNQYSKTMNETYLANTCQGCGSFIGEFFVHEYLYAGTVYDFPEGTVAPKMW